MNMLTVFEGGQWIAVEHVTGLFGEGDTEAEARDDLMEHCRITLADLDAHADRLHPDLEHERQYLRTELSA